MLYLAVLMYAIFFAGFAMTVSEGLWSNAITLFCVILAGVIALPGGLALGDYVLAQVQPAAENAWYFKFASVWGIYFFAINILRLSTDRLSRVRMKFPKPLDAGGGILMGLGVAMMLTSFAALTLFMPFAAGAWKTSEAAAWQQQTISTSASPMTAAVRAFHGDVVMQQLNSK